MSAPTAAEPKAEETREERFGRWLRKVRESKGLYAREVADKGGIGRGTYEGVERGNRPSRGSKTAGGVKAATLDKSPLSMFVAIAEGLDLDLGFVLHKAGFPMDAGGTNMARVNRIENIIEALDGRVPEMRLKMAEAMDRLEVVGDIETAAGLGLALGHLDLISERIREENQ